MDCVRLMAYYYNIISTYRAEVRFILSSSQKEESGKLFSDLRSQSELQKSQVRRIFKRSHYYVMHTIATTETFS